MHIYLGVSFLSQVLTRRGRDTTVYWKIERLVSQAGEECTGWIVQWMEITELVRIWRTGRADACDRCGCVESPE
jgi:hypothetical protein